VARALVDLYEELVPDLRRPASARANCAVAL
jgi:hypothetical protein